MFPCFPVGPESGPATLSSCSENSTTPLTTTVSHGAEPSSHFHLRVPRGPLGTLFLADVVVATSMSVILSIGHCLNSPASPGHKAFCLQPCHPSPIPTNPWSRENTQYKSFLFASGRFSTKTFSTQVNGFWIRTL